MADLLAKFRLVDEMSSKLSTIAESGQNMLTQWESAGETANEAMEDISGAATTTVSAVDGVATSLGALESTADNAASSSDTLSDALRDYSDSTSEAISQTDYWTDAVGNYDKSVLEAIYSTEELVDMGMKSTEALQEQEQMFELCEKSADYLNKSIKATTSIENDLSKALENATSITEKVSKSDDVSAKTKETLAKASTEATEAMKVLTAAQEEADAAMEAYNATIASGTTNLNELEAAAERAGHAAEALAEANGRATEATNEVSGATEKASEEAENGGKNALNTIEAVATALTSAGIVVKIKEIASETYELATAFSEAESIVVKATGASGRALDSLTESMMDAYSASKTGSLDDTAAAIGEINTRMALTGDELTSVTGKFLDFAEITGTNVVGSIQNVTKIMNKWDIEISDVESVLDKLTYAGQISGASVDSLSSTVIDSSATFQALDMNLDNAIGLLADLELYGTSSTTTVTALRTAVNNFTSEGLDAGEALRNVINEIANMKDATEATALAVDTFGSKAGQELAGAIRSGAISVDSISQSLDVAQGTLTATAEAAQTLDQKWEQANNNIQTAFSNVLQPTIDDASSCLADMANGMGDFLNNHPVVVKAITAVAVGVGAVAIAIAGFTFVTKVAIPALTSFGTALNTALGPIGWVALAITGIVAAGTALVAMMNDAEDETANMTATTKAQYYQLQDLNAEYEETCELYGENSEEALRLRYQVDDLSEAFEANRQTVEEFQAEVDELCTSVTDLWTEFDKNISEINANETSTLALIQKYEDLTEKAVLTAGEQKQLAAVTQSLADKFPDLASKVDDVTISTEAYIEALRKAAEQEATELRQNETDDAYVKALAERERLTIELAKAEENLRLEEEAFNSVDWAWWSDQAIYQKTGWDPFDVTHIDEYEEALEQVRSAIDKNEAEIAELERDYEILAEKEAEEAKRALSWQEAVSTAYEGVREKLEELCAAYDEAYQSALESFQGQFGLFDEASMQSEDYLNSNIVNAQKALDSQAAYWETYLSNIQVLKDTSAGELGVTQENYEALMAYAQDGSEEAAGLAASMAEAIQNGDKEAVKKLAETVGKINETQEELASTTADWVTDFDRQMKLIEREMKITVNKLDLSDEAAESAKSTITSYVDQIRAGKGKAVDAAKDVADAVAAALLNSTTEEPSTSTTSKAKSVSGSLKLNADGDLVPAYANGTTYSEDVFISGENGPELIVGKQGSTVFPTEETDRIISALNYRQRPLQVFADDNTKSNQEPPKAQEKHIRLEIAGGGTIEVNGSGKADKETILELLKEHLEPVLMNLIEGEMYEEGELSYEY